MSDPDAASVPDPATSRDVGERSQGYASPAILERRRRILAETRRTIAADGVGALSMNDIGLRAGVAKRTLYNAFRTRERMIATAIQEHFDDYVGQIVFDSPPGTMMHMIERLVTVVQPNVRSRNFISATLSLYFGIGVDVDVVRLLHRMTARQNMSWIASLHARRQLQPWIEPAALVDDLVRLEYATINEWAQERMTGDHIILRLVSAYLGFMLGAVRGIARREIEDLLKDIASQGVAALPPARPTRNASFI